MPEFNSHFDFFELLSLIRCGRNSAFETGLNAPTRTFETERNGSESIGSGCNCKSSLSLVE